MSSDAKRPTPDELLARIEAEEKHGTRGRLKVFLGYAAGVGKTYTMLEAARQRKNELDIVVAYVETHGRAETDALLQGLEIVPRKRLEYHGTTLNEMDIDAVLSRHPQLALVDELAHTNAPNSRHPKRYQDVEELLDAGIDVYTTLNVQHVESLQNVVAQVTGVWVRETVPDRVIDNAAEIEMVDLPPDELLKRLREGKVYIPEQASRATAEFFRKGNLIALRELTMRTAVVRVDEQMRAYMETHAISGPWPTADRLLVCISPSPMGTRLVRAARRLAAQLRAEWFAIYIETPRNVQLSSDQQVRLEDTLRLAERMGAKPVTIQGHSVAESIAEFANKNNITKIVVGKPQRKKWLNLFQPSVVNQIIGKSERFDVHIVSGRAEIMKQDVAARGKVFGNWPGYVQGMGLLVLATLLGHLVREFFSPANIIMIYLLCVAVTAVFWGRGPSIMVSILALLAFDFFFVPPVLSFYLVDPQYLFTFTALILVGIMVSYLTSRARQQTEGARRRERQTAALYALSRDLAVSTDLESYIRAIIKRTKETFALDTVIFLPDVQNIGKLKPYTNSPSITVGGNESAAALWSFQHQKVVGYGTDTLPDAKARYLPMITARGAVGVLALWFADTTGEINADQERILGAYADLAAVAIEGIRLAKEHHGA